ncbi:rhodanese-like domain-containing protein [bacterium]|nr:rhodanese-like domain-containing protein [bacterium]
MNNIKEISVQSLNKKINNNEKISLIDVREDEELKISKISQSIHIPMKTIPDNLNQISSDKTIIIMCKTGGRSAQVCEYLSNQGYSNVYNLKGGIISWALEIDSTVDIY